MLTGALRGRGLSGPEVGVGSVGVCGVLWGSVGELWGVNGDLWGFYRGSMGR